MVNLGVGLNQSNRIIGQRFGRLLIGEPTKHKAKNGTCLYLADCDCGNQTLIRADDVHNGATKSCGCLQRENRIANGHKRFQDLSGSIIGKLRILFRDGTNQTNQRKEAIYLCWCECGNIHHVKSNCLRSKRPTKSCGCSKVQMDLTGKKFGRLKVIKKVKKEKKKGYKWLCQCECGKQTKVDGYLLKKGRTKSCGCFGKEVTLNRNKNRLIDLSGKKFGNLTVIERIGTNGTGRESKPLWKCRCDCGRAINVTGNVLTMGKKANCSSRTSLCQLLNN